MKKETLQKIIFFMGWLAFPAVVLCQEEGPIAEEESAEISLEAHSDEFQVHFFEGLKQMGIENYDKAINAFLECLELAPEKDVVSFELAKAYLQDKQYINAQQYAEYALAADPGQYWYAHTLAESLRAQNLHSQHIQDEKIRKNETFRLNLAKIYFKLRDYNEAKTILATLEDTKSTTYLEAKIKDSLAEGVNTVKDKFSKKTDGRLKEGDAADYTKRIESLMVQGDVAQLSKISAEALERYPSQPFFYYAHGIALQKSGKNNEALESLEAALDYLIEDIPLENDIYRALVKTYTAMGQTEKATMYSNKIKPGPQ